MTKQKCDLKSPIHDLALITFTVCAWRLKIKTASNATSHHSSRHLASQLWIMCRSTNNATTHEIGGSMLPSLFPGMSPNSPNCSTILVNVAPIASLLSDRESVVVHRPTIDQDRSRNASTSHEYRSATDLGALKLLSVLCLRMKRRG